jgi:hypothetical protein
VKRGCDLLMLFLESKIKRSQPRFTRQLLQLIGVNLQELDRQSGSFLQGFSLQAMGSRLSSAWLTARSASMMIC